VVIILIVALIFIDCELSLKNSHLICTQKLNKINLNMKKILFAMAIAIITAVGLSSCGEDKKGETNQGTDATEQTSPKATDLDYEKLGTLVEKSELSSADYDFLLDQGEILNNKFKGMSKEEINAFRTNLSEEEMMGIMVIGLGLGQAEKDGKLSAAQLQRYEEMKANDPIK